jgi:hypothetical protein
MNTENLNWLAFDLYHSSTDILMRTSTCGELQFDAFMPRMIMVIFMPCSWWVIDIPLLILVSRILWSFSFSLEQFVFLVQHLRSSTSFSAFLHVFAIINIGPYAHACTYHDGVLLWHPLSFSGWLSFAWLKSNSYWLPLYYSSDQTEGCTCIYDHNQTSIRAKEILPPL